MKEWQSTVVIDASIRKVFAFTTNPKKTHLWIKGMKKEESSESPPTIGTTYRNTSDGKHWDDYEVIELEDGKLFMLAKKDSPYRVRYTYREISPVQTELTYHEWVEDGELEDPFSAAYLKALKDFIEFEITARPIFLEAREIPYRIATTRDEMDSACTGKHYLIKDALESAGYQVRWAECTFNWADIGAPQDILALHDSAEDLHAWLEVNIGGVWHIIDATWDSGLSNHLPLNEWDDFGSMWPAVPVLRRLSEGEVSVPREIPDEYLDELNRERPFLEAINTWFESLRQ
jgi:uncharacterized protein YndB with AHSA1/START domain